GMELENGFVIDVDGTSPEAQYEWLLLRSRLQCHNGAPLSRPPDFGRIRMLAAGGKSILQGQHGVASGLVAGAVWLVPAFLPGHQQPYRQTEDPGCNGLPFLYPMVSRPYSC